MEMVWGDGDPFMYSFSDTDSGDSLAYEPSPGPAGTGAASIVAPQLSTVRGLDLEKSSHMGLRGGGVLSSVPRPPMSSRSGRFLARGGSSMGPLPLGIARQSYPHDSNGAGSSGGGRLYPPLKLLGHMPLDDRTNRAGPAVDAATVTADLSPPHCRSSTSQPDSLRAVNASDPRRDVSIITHTSDGGFGTDSPLRPGPEVIAPLHPGMIGLNIMFVEAYTTMTKSLKKKLVESESSLSTLQSKYDELNAAKDLSDTDYAAFSERQYDAGRKHEQIERISRERNNVDADCSCYLRFFNCSCCLRCSVL